MKFSRPLLLALFALLALSLSACGRAPATNWPGLSSDGSAAYLSEGAKIYAINLQTGQDLLVNDKPLRFPAENLTTTFYAAPGLLPNAQMVVGNASQSEFSLYWFDQATGAPTHTYSEVKKPWFASPLVVGENIYAAGGDGILYAFGMDGAPQWKFQASEHALWATPSSDGKTLYLGTLDHFLYAISLESGKQVWKVKLDNGLLSSPAIDGQTLYVGTLSGKLYALKAADGSTLWQTDLQGGIWSAPTLNENGDRLYLGTVQNTSGTFYILNAADGSPLKTLARETGSIVASPLVLADQVIYVTDSGDIVWLTPEGESLRQPVNLKNAKLYTQPLLVGERILVAPMNYPNLLLAYDLNGAQTWAYTPQQ